MVTLSKRKQLTAIFSTISAIAILVILIVLWQFYQQYRTLTYSNKNDGFSLQYPANWSVLENRAGAAVIFNSPKETSLDSFQENVNIVVQDIANHPMQVKSLNEYTDLAIKQMQAVFKDNLVIVESEPARFAGRPGYKFVFLGKGPDMEFKFYCLWTMDENMKAYQFTFTAMAAAYDKYIQKVEMMGTSFKLL